MQNWSLHLRRRLTLRGIPAMRRHVYVVAGLFLITATIDNAIGNLQRQSGSAAESGTVDELVRLQQMAETADSLYQ